MSTVCTRQVCLRVRLRARGGGVIHWIKVAEVCDSSQPRTKQRLLRLHRNGAKCKCVRLWVWVHRSQIQVLEVFILHNGITLRCRWKKCRRYNCDSCMDAIQQIRWHTDTLTHRIYEAHAMSSSCFYSCRYDPRSDVFILDFKLPRQASLLLLLTLFNKPITLKG